MAYRRLAVITLAVLALAASACAQETVKLQMRFRPGQILRYKLIMDAGIAITSNDPAAPGAMDIPMRMVCVLSEKVKRILPNGDAEIIVTTDSAKVTVRNKTATASQKMSPVTMIVGPDGVVKDSPGLQNLFAQQSHMNLTNPAGLNQLAALPSTELSVGESWSRSIPFPFGGGNVLLIGRLLSADEPLGNAKVAVIQQDISGDLDIGKMAMSFAQGNGGIPPGAGFKGTITGSNTTFFDCARGVMARNEGRVGLQASASAPGSARSGPKSVSIDLNMSFEMYLLPAK